MKHPIFITLIFLTAISCNLFSCDGKQKATVSVNHLVESELSLICEGDNETIPALTDSILAGSGMNSEIQRTIKDSIEAFFLTGEIMSNTCLADEVVFPKSFFSSFSKDPGIDSAKIAITRDFSDMSFNGYSFITKNSNERVKTELLDNDLDQWRISINGRSTIVTIKENLNKKSLFLLTQQGDTISFPGIQPYRCYLSPIRFAESLKVFYSNGQVYSGSVNSNKLSSKANLMRFSEDLNTAKKI